MKKIILLTVLGLILTTMIAWGKPIVVLTTDFGLNGDAVGLCHGAILAISNEIEVVDLCHNIKPFDIKQASFTLKRTDIFPKGTVFVGVIDPGVGTNRTSIAIKTKKGLYYIAPNNGLLTHVIKNQGIEEVYELDNKKINPNWVQGTFDGKDLYSPAGAILATSGLDLNSIGHPSTEANIILLNFKNAAINENKITGLYMETDLPYGNIWTNITGEDLKKIGVNLGDKIHISIGKLTMDVPFNLSFGDVPSGAHLAYINSDGTVAFAINMENFQKTYNLEEGMEVTIEKVKK